MADELKFLEKWSGKVNTVAIGATKQEGGTRASKIIVGGETGLPFLFEESDMPNKPVIAFEIWDASPEDWPDVLKEPYKEVLTDVSNWAKKAVADFGAELICLRLLGCHPDNQNRKPEEAVETVKAVLKAVDVPLIILGCGDDAKDNQILPLCSEAAKGERCLIGEAVQDNYKTLTASVMADGHNIIAQSPIDINIAKQLNILISDMGLNCENIVINPTIGALGYGLEYAYSIMERARLAALGADKMLAMPFICLVGHEAWRAKEAKAKVEEFPEWGSNKERGIIWETITATSLLQAGADILVMRHPHAIKLVKQTIEELMKK